MDSAAGPVQELLRDVRVPDRLRRSGRDALRSADRVVPARDRSNHRPSAMAAGARVVSRRLGHADDIPAVHGTGADRRAGEHAARYLRHGDRRAALVDAARFERLDGNRRGGRRNDLRVDDGLDRAVAADVRLGPGKIRHEQGSASLARRVPRRQGNGRAFRLGGHQRRRGHHRRRVEHDRETGARRVRSHRRPSGKRARTARISAYCGACKRTCRISRRRYCIGT